MTLQCSFTGEALIRKPTKGNKSACGDVEFDANIRTLIRGIPPRRNIVTSLGGNQSDFAASSATPLRASMPSQFPILFR